MFKQGQRVAFLYEKGYGVIKSIHGQQVEIEDEDGFDRTFPLNELVYIHSEKYGEQSYVAEEELVSKLNYRIVPEKTISSDLRSLGHKASVTWEIDLHIEELLDSHSGLTNTDILMKQMKEFKNIFKKAKADSVNKLIVIHGVGEGVLKNEIRMFLMNQEQVDVYDADYSEYGKGATTIEFHPNWV